jgi:hypothetical protein
LSPSQVEHKRRGIVIPILFIQILFIPIIIPVNFVLIIFIDIPIDPQILRRAREGASFRRSCPRRWWL